MQALPYNEFRSQNKSIGLSAKGSAAGKGFFLPKYESASPRRFFRLCCLFRRFIGEILFGFDFGSHWLAQKERVGQLIMNALAKVKTTKAHAGAQ